MNYVELVEFVVENFRYLWAPSSFNAVWSRSEAFNSSLASRRLPAWIRTASISSVIWYAVKVLQGCKCVVFLHELVTDLCIARLQYPKKYLSFSISSTMNGYSLMIHMRWQYKKTCKQTGSLWEMELKNIQTNMQYASHNCEGTVSMSAPKLENSPKEVRGKKANNQERRLKERTS